MDLGEVTAGERESCCRFLLLQTANAGERAQGRLGELQCLVASGDSGVLSGPPPPPVHSAYLHSPGSLRALGTTSGLRASHTFVISLDPHPSLWKAGVTTPIFQNIENRGSERPRHSPKVTQLEAPSPCARLGCLHSDFHTVFFSPLGVEKQLSGGGLWKRVIRRCPLSWAFLTGVPMNHETVVPSHYIDVMMTRSPKGRQCS